MQATRGAIDVSDNSHPVLACAIKVYYRPTMFDELEQIEICKKYDAAFVPVDTDLKVGISRTVRDGRGPFHGLRHAPEGDTNGWFIWAGEMSQDPDFFVPLHVSHLAEWCSVVTPFLGLPPGWRFLVDGDYDDVWFDESLLED